MMYRVFGFFTDILCFQTDRFLTGILCLLALIFFFGYSHIIVLKRGKALLWIGVIGVVLGIGLMGGVYLWRSPRGLSGSYYDNPSWSGEPVNSIRYFETPGRRVDRFIDFNSNDFNNRYPFSGNPFSIIWQGYVYTPGDAYQLGVKSTFGAWLYVDDELVEGPHKIDFGTPEARTYLREGWSVDELWGEDPNLTFVWSSEHRSEFYLGVDERTDYTLIFRCIPFSYEGSSPQELTVYLNRIPLETITLQEGWSTYSLPVPRSLLQDIAPGFFRVRFTYSNVARPSDVTKQSKDGRQLAVAFDFAAMLPSSGKYLDKINAIFSVRGESVEPHSASFDKFRANGLLQSPLLSQGVHHIILKAQSDGDNPFIRLVWKRGKENNIHVIPEDYLFPQTSFPDGVPRMMSLERLVLDGIIVYKLLVIFFLEFFLVIYIIPPYFKKLLTWDSLFILGIGVFAFGIRMMFLLERMRIDPTFFILPHGSDQLTYVFFARGFFRGYWPGLSHGPFYFNVLISFYYVLCAILFEEGLFIIRTVSAMLATGSVWLTYLISRQVFNKPVAYIAAILGACNGILIFYDTSLLIAPVITFLGLVILWLLLKLKEQVSWRTTIALGGALGITALARANIFLFMPVLLFWMILCCLGSIRQKVLHYVVVCLVMFVVILPVTLRNYLSTDEHPVVLINSGGGIMLWMGNNPSASGKFDVPNIPEDVKMRMKAQGSSFSDEVIQYIKDQPLDYLKLEHRKLKMFWQGYELANLLPYYIFRYNSKILRLPWINFVLIGPLGIIGMVLGLRRWKSLFILYGFVFVQMLSTLLFFALARYRLPAVPVLSMFAAYAIYVVIQAMKNKQWYIVGMALGLFVVLYGILNYPCAAHLYQDHYGEPMPFVRIFRYWDLFHI